MQTPAGSFAAPGSAASTRYPGIHAGGWSIKQSISRPQLFQPQSRCPTRHRRHALSDRFSTEDPLPLSLYHPYKNLPHDGAMIPSDEESCNPEEQRCKTPTYIYETKCHSCAGTGVTRSIPNGRKGRLGNCMLCHGLGYVRCTTARFVPDVKADDTGKSTIGRPPKIVKGGKGSK